MSNQGRDGLRIWRKSAGDLHAGWRPLLFFDLLFKLVSFAVLAPVSALFLGWILRWSGDRAISNFDLISFFLSLPGILLIVVTATLGFAVTFLELGGLAVIALGVGQGKQMTALRTLLFLGRNLRRLCLLGFRQFLILGGIAAVVLAIAMVTKATVLSGGDLYFYLQTKPPEYWTAIAIIGGAGLAAGVIGVVLIIRWIFSVPLLLIENRNPAESMVMSRALVRESGAWSIVKDVAVWAAGALLILIISGAIQWLLDRILTGIAGDRVSWMIASAALLQAFGLVLGAVAGFVMAVAFSSVIAHLFSEIRPALKLPDSLIAGDAVQTPEKRLRARWCFFGGAALLAVIAAAFAFLLINRIQIDTSVAITAHRGSSLAAPENTMAAIVQAIEDGSDYVEIDVQETADGIVVLIHDTDLRRLAGVQRNTWEVPYAEMREFDIGSWFGEDFAGERIVTLEEAIEAVRGKSKLNIELKFNGHDKQLEAAVVRIIEEQNFEGDCIVMSLEYGGMREVARLNEGLKTGLTLTAGVGNATDFEVDFLAVGANSITRELVTRAHRKGMEVHVWTVNEPDQMLTMIHLGVDNIITDDPRLLTDLLREREKLSNAEKTLLYISDILAGRL